MNFYTCTYPCNHHQDQNRGLSAAPRRLSKRSCKPHCAVSHALHPAFHSQAAAVSSQLARPPAAWNRTTGSDAPPEKTRSPCGSQQADSEPCWDFSGSSPQEGTADLSRRPDFRCRFRRKPFTNAFLLICSMNVNLLFPKPTWIMMMMMGMGMMGIILHFIWK